MQMSGVSGMSGMSEKSGMAGMEGMSCHKHSAAASKVAKEQVPVADIGKSTEPHKGHNVDLSI